MTVEFISLVNVWESSELHPRPGGAPDAKYIKKYARSLEDGGFDYTLVAYHSGGYDPFTVSATIAAYTDRIKPIVALRPNTMYPTVAAQSLATLDHLSGGRAVVHIISGGSDAEQARQGDYVPKDDRYARSEEYVKLLRRAWHETKPWDHDGRFYPVRELRGRIPAGQRDDLGVHRRLERRGVPGRRSARRHLRPLGRAAQGNP